MIRNKTMKLVIGGLFIALGVVFPYFTGHAFGLPGTVLLPMHIPVLIAGFLLGPVYGLGIGIVTPIVSSVLTGMPAAFPMLPVMILELGVYGMVSGYLRPRLHLYGTLLCAMVLGRIVAGAMFSLLVAQSLNLTWQTITGNITTGLIGIAVQLAFIPALVKLLENALGMKRSPASKKPLVLEQAIEEISAGKSTIVLIKDGKAIYRGSGPGVRPFLVLLETPEGRELLKGAMVVDKLIGKGAAMLATLGEASSVYGVTMSESGKAFLQKQKKFGGHTRCIDVISNRKRDGICPIEQSVKDTEDPAVAYDIIKATVKELMANKAS